MIIIQQSKIFTQKGKKGNLADTMIFAQCDLFWIYDLQSCKTINVCYLKSLKLC